MSDTYYLIIEVMDITLLIIWSVIMCRLYHHFFKLRFHPESRWMTFLPGIVLVGTKRILDAFMVVTLSTPAESMKSLFRQLLVYGILLLSSFLFYQGSKSSFF